MIAQPIKNDLYFSVITGLISGFIGFAIFDYLQTPNYAGISFAWLIVIVPLLWILGVNLGYILGRWLNFFNQFGKFAAVGLTNAAVDFGAMYLLLVLLDASVITKGGAYPLWYAGVKSISFLVATMHSFIWNKYWVFSASNSQGGKVELAKFFSVSISAWLISVGVATAVVAWVHPLFGISPNGWDGFSAIIGSAIALSYSFTGFKLAVFRK